jgi:hypothetical protein
LFLTGPYETTSTLAEFIHFRIGGLICANLGSRIGAKCPRPVAAYRCTHRTGVFDAIATRVDQTLYFSQPPHALANSSYLSFRSPEGTQNCRRYAITQRFAVDRADINFTGDAHSLHSKSAPSLEGPRRIIFSGRFRHWRHG